MESKMTCTLDCAFTGHQWAMVSRRKWSYNIVSKLGVCESWIHCIQKDSVVAESRKDIPQQTALLTIVLATYNQPHNLQQTVQMVGLHWYLLEGYK